MIGSTHSIDWLEFGPDGNLWVSVGDGQAWEGTDWFDWLDQDYLGPMSLDYLGGKMLRLDENGRGVPGNPWYRGIPEESRGMIWARGVRQGWRCDFIPGSPLDEIELLCGNVGWYSREAVLRISKGGNLGWPCFEGAVPVPYFFYNGVRINATDHPECGKYYRGETEGYKGVEDVQPWDVSGVPYAYEHAGGSAAVTGGIWVEGIPMPENVEVDEGAAEGKTSTGGLRPTVKMAPNLGNLGKATKATLSILKKSSSKALSLLKESTTGTGRFVKATPRLANARTSSKPVKRQVNSTISNFNVTSNSTSEPCFLFADFVRSTVYCLPWNFTASQPIGFDATKNGTETYKYVNPIKVAEGMDQPVTFRRGPDGNVWVLGHCVSCSSYGVIRRLIPPGGNTTLPYGKDVAEPTKGAGGVGMVGPILSGDACYPKDKPKVVVPELPKGWEPIIYFPKFPNILYYRNGLGPIEINAAVGGAAPLDGSLLSVAGVWYQRGLGTRTVSEVHLPVLGYCHRVYVEVGIGG